MTQPKLYSAVTGSFTVVVICGIAVHFFIIWLYLAPINPVKLRMWPLVKGYTEPVFQQNWNLFAPTPVNQNQITMIKVRWIGRPDQQEHQTDWIDITTPTVAHVHRFRVSPLHRVGRPHLGVARQLAYQDPLLKELRERRGQNSALPPESETIALTATELAQRDRGLDTLYRIASAYAGKMIPSHASPVAVNVQIVHHKFPRFSQRHLPDSAGTYSATEFGWRPIQVVASP